MRQFFFPAMGTFLFLLSLISCTSAPPKPEEVPQPEEAEPPETEEAPPPPPVEIAAYIGDIYRGPEDTAAALDALKDVDIKALTPASRVVYAILLRGAGRLSDSRQELESLLKENSGNADAWFNLALVEHAEKNEEASDAALKAALEAENTPTAAYIFQGQLAREQSNPALAEKAFDKALQQDPQSVEALMGMAWVLAKTERKKEAEPFLDKAVKLDPNYAYARIDRARLSVILDKYGNALKDLTAAIELEPDVSWHYLDRARLRLRYLRDLDGALKDLKRVEELDPDNFSGQVYLAGLYDEMRVFDKAKTYYERVVKIRPDYFWAYEPLGKLNWIDKNYRESMKWFEKAAERDPDAFSYRLMIAMELQKEKKIEEAQRRLSLLLRQFKTEKSIYEVVRFCYEGRSDYYAVDALNKEKDKTLRERLWFYMGLAYDLENNAPGTRAAFERISGLTGAMEFDMAQGALNRADREKQ